MITFTAETLAAWYRDNPPDSTPPDALGRDSDGLEELQSLAARLGAGVEVRRVETYSYRPEDSYPAIAVYEVHPTGHVDVIGPIGDAEMVRDFLASEVARREKCQRLRSRAVTAGHDPLPSFLYRFRDDDEDPPVERLLGPAFSGLDPDSTRYPYDTCYPSCAACALGQAGWKAEVETWRTAPTSENGCQECGKAISNVVTGRLHQGTHETCWRLARSGLSAMTPVT